MKHIHDQEKQQFEKLFRQEGIDRIEDRLFVMDTFLDIEHHVTAEELSQVVAKERSGLADSFIDDTLLLMERFGFAHKVRFAEEGPVRYEHRHIGHHHDHMICTRCGKILEFEDPDLEAFQDRIAEKHGFTLLQHRMELYGLCQNCNEDREGAMTLVSARAGETLFIDAFLGGSTGRMRLLSMGLRIGDCVEVISTQGPGQLVVAICGRRYSLGRGLSEKILVHKGRREEVCPAPGQRWQENCRHAIGPAETTEDQVVLSAMKEGDAGYIVKVGGCGILRRRILEMGLTRGSHVVVEKYAPLKDPMEVVVKGTHISLRVSEARHIVMEKEDGPDGK